MSDDEPVVPQMGKEFARGAILFRDGDVGHDMYVIQSGRVRITKNVRGVDKTLGTLGPGEFFGEMSILNNQPRSATVIVEDHAKLLVIDAKTFEGMVRGNAEIAVRMIKKLAGRLQDADEQIENLLLRDHNSRVVHFLASYAKRSGKSVPDGMQVGMGCRELANKMGLEEGAVQEVLDKLAKAKLVTLHSSTIVVHDVKRLGEFLDFLGMKEKFGEL